MRLVDEFVALKDQLAEPPAFLLHEHLSASIRLALPRLGEQLHALDRIRPRVWPNTRWALRLATARARAQERHRALKLTLHPASGSEPPPLDAESYQLVSLHDALKQIKALIADEYPSVLLVADLDTDDG